MRASSGALGGRARGECPVGDTSRDASRCVRCCGGVRFAVQGAAKTEVAMSGQLALVSSEEALVAAAVWETLPPQRQVEVALRLARLLARLMEAARDE